MKSTKRCHATVTKPPSGIPVTVRHEDEGRNRSGNNRALTPPIRCPCADESILGQVLSAPSFGRRVCPGVGLDRWCDLRRDFETKHEGWSTYRARKGS
eukprot:scaffold128_cov328-Pavlova_lutheri.AAC.39